MVEVGSSANRLGTGSGVSSVDSGSGSNSEQGNDRNPIVPAKKSQGEM